MQEDYAVTNPERVWAGGYFRSSFRATWRAHSQAIFLSFLLSLSTPLNFCVTPREFTVYTVSVGFCLWLLRFSLNMLTTTNYESCAWGENLENPCDAQNRSTENAWKRSALKSHAQYWSVLSIQLILILSIVQWNLAGFNEPLFNEVLDITNDILRPGQSYSKMYGIELRYNEFFDITNIFRNPKRKIYLETTNYNVNTLNIQHATADKRWIDQQSTNPYGR